MKQPTPIQIKITRKKYGLTQAQAADAVGYSMRAWQDWERDINQMPAAVFELFKIKCSDQFAINRDYELKIHENEILIEIRKIRSCYQKTNNQKTKKILKRSMRQAKKHLVDVQVLIIEEETEK